MVVPGSQQNGKMPNELKKDLNPLVILVSSKIWKHKNVCVFEGTSPGSAVLR